MDHWQSASIDVDGVRLHYTRTSAGGSKPPVVLAHGGSDDGLCWTPIAQALEADNDLIMPDARGHGQSDAPETPYGIADLAGDLAGLIQALGLHKPTIAGHSMGGATALALASLYPDVPGAILLEDAGPIRIPTTRSPEDEQRWARMRTDMEALKSKTREQLIEAVRLEHPDWPEAELGPWADSKLRYRSSGSSLFSPNAPQIDWSAVLGMITCPVLLIAADLERGGMITEERAQEFQAQVPQARVVHVAGAGHNIRREQPARFLELVRPFLHETSGNA